MEDIIGTLVIMLFCIIALAREKTSENVVVLSRAKTNPLIPVELQVESSVISVADISKFCKPTRLQVRVGSRSIVADVKNNLLRKAPTRLGVAKIRLRHNFGEA
ncbi:hypothetical protein SAMN05216464_108186 [Mucilaginibacter pineti]|uniref:Uncharacterized protein n=1 Tax=Mucilaginibacter pineti TaxID=1391627 RepID=A0A1G7EW64_9SPHI|nr:hypothetical protein [Mucilaginibacter pineti]SDE67910.1 hypothetical protein SAMN05216464_108186 [Mucilaginibacter pineti]